MYTSMGQRKTQGIDVASALHTVLVHTSLFFCVKKDKLIISKQFLFQIKYINVLRCDYVANFSST